MPTFQKKTVVKSYKTRINKKFKTLREETNDVVTKLQACVSVFEKRLEELLQKSDENFLEHYQKLTEDFENHQEKLCYFLTAIENTANNEDSEGGESEENLSADDTSISPSHQVDHNSLLESKSSIVSSSYHSTQDNKNTTGSQFISRSNRKDVLPGHLNEHQVDLPVHSRESFPSEAKPSVSNWENSGTKSVSQSSCYQSLSAFSSDKVLSISSRVLDSPISANTQVKQIECDNEPFLPVSAPEPESPISANTEVKSLDCDNEPFLSVPEDDLQIPPCEVPLNVVFSASLSHIVDPSDFWMQLQSSKVNNMVFPLSEFYDDTPPPFIKKGSFCLAPLKFLRYYYRAKVLNDALGCEDVEVQFVDHGSVQKMSLKNLRALPRYAYETPLQTFHCKLFNVLPVDQVWTPEAGEKLRGFQNNHIETLVKSFDRDTFVVQLTANISSFFDEFSCDIAEALCLDGLAVLEMDPLLDQECCITENSNQTSCDSGVSVSSNPTASLFPNRSFSSDPMESHVPFNPLESLRASFNKSQQASETASSEKTYSKNLVPFDGSDDTIGGFSLSDPKLWIPPCKPCSRSTNCGCMLHINIPPPRISFVQEGMMLVMLSHITSPSEFYVNLAMEDSTSLDDLQEKMTTFYENETNPKLIDPGCLMEDMICAGRYSDNNWYRVVILSTEHQNDKSSEVYLQYIDYGNKSFVKCSNLRPLLPEFASYPLYSIMFSLAGIMPKRCDSDTTYNSTHWSKAAINKFLQLASFERCLTAQDYESRQYTTPNIETRFSERKPIKVLLWDCQGAEDLLINGALLESGVADLDLNFMREHEVDDLFSSKEKTLLKYWDPMKDEFNSISNSYGVDVDDTEVAVTGYKQKDEDYTCKYYSLRGYCPRGNYCPFKHFELDSGGYTRDQDEVYSMDLVPPLPDVPSHVLVTVSAIKSPGLFYSVLPFGKNTVDDVDLLQFTEPLECKKYKDEVDALYNALNDHYNESVFAENTTVALAYGSIVVAFHEGCKAWQRGRIVELTDITGPCKVFFVDFGDECWVPRKSIRQILPEYLFTPFQAVECRISDIEPLGYEKGEKWSAQAINRFKELVINEIMLAHITARCGNSLHVKLRSTREDNHSDVSEVLVKEGFAQYVTVKTVKYKESKYMPG